MRAAAALGLGLEIVAAGAAGDPAPLPEVGVGVAQPGAHRGAVDRLLKALGQRPLGAPPPGLDDHLRGDVAPADDDQLGHGRASAGAASPRKVGAGLRS